MSWFRKNMATRTFAMFLVNFVPLLILWGIVYCAWKDGTYTDCAVLGMVIEVVGLAFYLVAVMLVCRSIIRTPNVIFEKGKLQEGVSTDTLIKNEAEHGYVLMTLIIGFLLLLLGYALKSDSWVIAQKFYLHMNFAYTDGIATSIICSFIEAWEWGYLLRLHKAVNERREAETKVADIVETDE